MPGVQDGLQIHMFPSTCATAIAVARNGETSLILGPQCYSDPPPGPETMGGLERACFEDACLFAPSSLTT